MSRPTLSARIRLSGALFLFFVGSAALSLPAAAQVEESQVTVVGSVGGGTSIGYVSSSVASAVVYFEGSYEGHALRIDGTTPDEIFRVCDASLRQRRNATRTEPANSVFGVAISTQGMTRRSFCHLAAMNTEPSDARNRELVLHGAIDGLPIRLPPMTPSEATLLIDQHFRGAYGMPRGLSIQLAGRTLHHSGGWTMASLREEIASMVLRPAVPPITGVILQR